MGIDPRDLLSLVRPPEGSLMGLRSKGIVGPWPCEACGQLSQFADIGPRINRIFCRNERCGFQRIIDKAAYRIVENDGTCWEFDNKGRKWQVTGV
jgi:hypothetical protein